MELNIDAVECAIVVICTAVSGLVFKCIRSILDLHLPQPWH